MDDLESQSQSSGSGRLEQPSGGKVASGDLSSAPPSGAKQPAPPRTRTSVAFQALIAGVVVLALLLIFILENTESVHINYLGAKGSLSLGVALLLGAVGGALITAMIGAARIAQLRRHARRR